MMVLLTFSLWCGKIYKAKMRVFAIFAFIVYWEVRYNGFDFNRKNIKSTYRRW